MKKILIAALFIILCYQITAFADNNVVIEAKKQEMKVDKNKGYFNGDVKGTGGDVTVQSPRAELDLDP